MIAVAVSHTQRPNPRVLRPLVDLGQRSYEVYLTHMFVVFFLFNLFLSAGKPMYAVPFLFAGAILGSAIFGDAVARIYSEPMNRLLRKVSSKTRPYRKLLTCCNKKLDTKRRGKRGGMISEIARSRASLR
jgi:peptidoglycan/LPS O-acetylase OafA/YrhL